MSYEKQNCINPEIGRLLEDAMSDALLAPGRERERELFLHIHFEECRSCRDAMLDHANELALIELATERQAPIEEVLESLSEFAQQLQETADREGVSLAEVLETTLNQKQQLYLSANQAETR